MSPALSWNLRERSSFIYRILHIIDCSLVCVTLWLLVTLYKVPWSNYYTQLELIVFSISFVSFQFFQMYRSWRGWKYYREFLVISQAWATVLGALLFYFFIFKTSEGYSRLIFMVWALIMPFILFLCHLIVRKFLRYYREQGKNIRHAVIAGAGDLGVRMARQMEEIPWAGIEVVGFFDDKIESQDKIDKPLLGRIDSIQHYLQNNDIDYVYIALPMRAERKIFKILSECRDQGAHIYLVPDLYIFGLHHAEIQSLGEMLILNFNPARTWKRGFDVVFSSVVLLLFSPLFLLIATIIKLDDGGTIFYRHKRITTTGKEFGCLKFRTMVKDASAKLQKLLAENPEMKAEWEKGYKLKNDPRVTRIGRLLRRTSLDELPQFYNVFKGEMSVVGARPIVDSELHQYYRGNGEESAGRYCSMKPGITGPWQVMKRNDMDDYQERVQLDDWYVLNFSFWNDLKIIVKTVICVFTGKGAY